MPFLLAFGACLLFLFLICPRIPGRDLGELKQYLYAHRGLWSDAAPENSLAAFRAAVEAGFGIELDVQMTKDRQLVVFHDSDVFRMCGKHGKICEMTYEEVRTLHLCSSSETIPSFREVLELTAGRVPLIVEIKGCPDLGILCRQAAEMLDRYPGPFCIESFHPLAVRWFRFRRPAWIRGQLAFGLAGGKYRKTIQNLLVSSLLQNCLSRPDFIAFDAEADRSFPFRLVCRLFHPWTVGWTIPSKEAMHLSEKKYDLLIFEGFVPDTKGESASAK